MMQIRKHGIQGFLIMRGRHIHLEIAMDANEDLHGTDENVITRMASFLDCGMRVLNFAHDIHCREYHLCPIVIEADSAQDEGKMCAAMRMV